MPLSINIPATLAKQPVRCAGTNHSADRIGDEVIPARVPARQIDLVPLIQQTHQQHAGYSQDEHAPATKATRHAESHRKQRKHAAVSQLVPGRRDQPHRDRLRAADKQGYDNSHANQHGQQTQSSQ